MPECTTPIFGRGSPSAGLAQVPWPLRASASTSSRADVNMERELWPGLDRWVSASETTNRGVLSHHRGAALVINSDQQGNIGSLKLQV